MTHSPERFESSETSVIDLEIEFVPISPKVENLYTTNSSARTFEDVMSEMPELGIGSEEWLRRNIRESMEKNADIWSQLAKH